MTGRPRKDSIDTHMLIVNLAAKGMSNKDIAKITNLSLRTVQYWLKNDTGLKETVDTVRTAIMEFDTDKKAQFNRLALMGAKRLLKKRKSVEIERRTDGHGQLLLEIERIKEIEPNAGMVQFVLKNTDPHNWSDNPEAVTTDEAEDNELTINIIDGEKENAIG